MEPNVPELSGFIDLYPICFNNHGGSNKKIVAFSLAVKILSDEYYWSSLMSSQHGFI